MVGHLNEIWRCEYAFSLRVIGRLIEALRTYISGEQYAPVFDAAPFGQQATSRPR